METTNAILLVVVVAGALIAASAMAYSYLPAQGSQAQYTQQQFQKALASELPDKCATPAGYSDQDWKEHMGHHPDLYKECL